MRRSGMLFVGACALALCVCATAGRGVNAQDERWGRPVYAGTFRVDVLVNGYPLEQYPARGRLYVEAFAGAEYALRIYNPLPDRVAVALAVDGLNTIDASHTTARAASKWVIEPYGAITIAGWQMSSTRARRFYFTTEGDSYGAKLGRAADLGVITAVFFRERRPVAVVVPRPYPTPLEDRRRSDVPKERSGREEPDASGAQGAGQPRGRAAAPVTRDDEYAATGIGRSVDHDVRWTHMDLEDAPAGVVSLRYEYRPALVRLGILPRTKRDGIDSLERRERARGFRDQQFCPEP